MYHEERIINGVLHHRSSPRGSWTPYSAESLTSKNIAKSNAIREHQVEMSEKNKVITELEEKLSEARYALAVVDQKSAEILNALKAPKVLGYILM